MNALLLDTCVWLDYYLPERPGHEAAFKLVDAACRNDCPLLIAAHSLKDFWYVFWQTGKQINKKYGTLAAEDASKAAKKAAWGASASIAEHATIVASGQGETWLTLKMRNAHDDFEDNLVIAAALRAKPQYLVTTDQQLIAHSPVATVTPNDALAFLELL